MFLYYTQAKCHKGKLVNKKNQWLVPFMLAAGILSCGVANAWHGHGGAGYYNGHEHGHGGAYYPERRAYPGYYYGWSGPNIVINVPTRPYYVPRCETVEVCNSFDQCWLERHCN